LINGSAAQAGPLSTNKVIRNTYALLSLTLIFSAVTAGISMALNLPHPGILLTLAGYFGLLFATASSELAVGLLCVFALTAHGLHPRPILTTYLSLANGGQIVMTAMATTGVLFLVCRLCPGQPEGLQLHGGFLVAGILVAFVAGLGAIFFEIPALSLAVSASFVLLMAGLILYETSNIIHGGETNYIMPPSRYTSPSSTSSPACCTCWAS